MVGSNNRKQKSSSEIQNVAKKAKRHHSSPVLKVNKIEEIDEATQHQRLEDFRKSLMIPKEENKLDEANKNEKLMENSNSDDSMDFDWDAVLKEAEEKNLQDPQTLKRQVSTETEEYERLFLALPYTAEEAGPSNVEKENNLPSTSHISNIVKTPKLETFAKKRVIPSEKPTESVAVKEEIESTSSSVINQPNGSVSEAESHEEIKKRIQRNREEALRRLKLNKIPVPPPLAESSSTSNQNDLPVQSAATSSEIQQRIEKNRQEALRRLKQNGLIPSVKENILVDSNASTSKNADTLQAQKEPAVPSAANKGILNEALAGTSSKTLSEEEKLKIEEKRLEALRRREIWRKNQEKGTK